MLALQPMLFTDQYILSTLLPIPSTWENSHSFVPSLSLSFFLFSTPSILIPHPFHMPFSILLHPWIIFVYSFKSSVRYFQIKFTVAVELIYIGQKRRNTGERKYIYICLYIIYICVCLSCNGCIVKLQWNTGPRDVKMQ